MQYAFGKTVQMSQQQAIERVTQELAKEGFGILTEIDVAATLKKKLGVDVPACRILGACNPQFAHQALQAEPQIGALLPCNVVVRTTGSRSPGWQPRRRAVIWPARSAAALLLVMFGFPYLAPLLY